jgi:radical SAM protein with 4Fe4S-binding SPASM domain
MFITNTKIFNHLYEESNNKIITAELHLTNKCNNNCYYCGANKKNGVSMNVDDIDTSLEFLEKINVKGLIFTGGGEPTVHKLFQETIEKASKIFDIGLITNGVKPIDLKIVNNFTWIKFSLDAADPDMYEEIRGVDAYNKVINNIKNVISNKNKTTIGIQVVVNKYNIKLLDCIESILYHNLKDYDYLSFRPIESTKDPYNKEEKEKIIEFISKKRFPKTVISDKFFKSYDFNHCHIANYICTIDPMGDIYLCCHHVGNKKYKFGNINDHDFYNNRDIVLKNLKDNGYCKKCPIGCRGAEINQTLHKLKNQKHVNFL